VSDGFCLALSGRELDNAARHDPTDRLIDRLSGAPEEEPEPDSATDWRARLPELQHLLQMLPAVEQDLLHLSHQGMRQVDLAQLFGLTQAAISYRVRRARERLLFLRDFPQPSLEEMQRDLAGVLDPQYIIVLWDMSGTTSQTHTAARLGWTQGRVRFALLRIAERLAATTAPELATYRSMIAQLSERRNLCTLIVQGGRQGRKGPVEYAGRLALDPLVPPVNDGTFEVSHAVGVVDRGHRPSSGNVVALDFSPRFEVDLEDEGTTVSLVL
jgi:hypothetical protein